MIGQLGSGRQWRMFNSLIPITWIDACKTGTVNVDSCNLYSYANFCVVWIYLCDVAVV